IECKPSLQLIVSEPLTLFQILKHQSPLNHAGAIVWKPSTHSQVDAPRNLVRHQQRRRSPAVLTAQSGKQPITFDGSVYCHYVVRSSPSMITSTRAAPPWAVPHLICKVVSVLMSVPTMACG